jgi:hypothetical protein
LTHHRSQDLAWRPLTKRLDAGTVLDLLVDDEILHMTSDGFLFATGAAIRCHEIGD